MTKTARPSEPICLCGVQVDEDGGSPSVPRNDQCRFCWSRWFVTYFEVYGEESFQSILSGYNTTPREAFNMFYLDLLSNNYRIKMVSRHSRSIGRRLVALSQEKMHDVPILESHMEGSNWPSFLYGVQVVFHGGLPGLGKRR